MQTPAAVVDVTAATFEIDLTSITTDNSMRDDNVQDALETSSFPTAQFVLTEPVDVAPAADGTAITIEAVGDLTVHGVTRTTTFELDAQLVDDTVVVAESTPVVFSDFGVAVPSSPMVLSVDDEGLLELQLLFTRG